MRFVASSSFLVMMALCGGCFALPRDGAPNWPTSIPVARLADSIREQLKEDVEAQYHVSIVGAAIPDSGEPGLFAYLLVASNPPSAHLRSYATSIGLSLSRADHPNRFVEVVDQHGAPVPLMPMTYPESGWLFQPTIVDYAAPPNESGADEGPNRAVIQACIWRLKGRLLPGTYRLRLLPPEPSDERYGWMWQPQGGVQVNTDWASVRIDVQASD